MDELTIGTNMTIKSNRRTLPHKQSTYLNLPVMTHRGNLDIDYLNSINTVIEQALDQYRRVFAFRIDLRFPTSSYSAKTRVMSNFIASLNEQIIADLKRKQKHGGRNNTCTLRYVWAKERNKSLSNHYHVLLLLNKDVYHCLGYYKVRTGNLASRIMKAWGTAIGLSIEESADLVHFPKNPIYYLDSNKATFHDQLAELFYRASYLAKVETKEYGTKERSFGRSRK